MRNREKGGQTVNSDQSNDFIKELCESGRIDSMLDKYILYCSAGDPLRQNALSHSDKSDKSEKQDKSSFPNLAGFCRYLEIGMDELTLLAQEYPLIHGRILAVLEDEALNSKLSPTLVSAYLKKRLNYGSEDSRDPLKNQLQIKFEHDIFEDGE